MIEMIRLTNLRRVSTKVTVSDEHSVVSTNTELMHTYCVSVLPSKYSQISGTLTYSKSMGSVHTPKYIKIVIII